MLRDIWEDLMSRLELLGLWEHIGRTDLSQGSGRPESWVGFFQVKRVRAKGRGISYTLSLRGEQKKNFKRLNKWSMECRMQEQGRA